MKISDFLQNFCFFPRWCAAIFICLLLISCNSSPSDLSEKMPFNLGTKPRAAPHSIALLVPLHGNLAGPGAAVKEGFMNAYQQSNHNDLQVAVYDTTQNGGILQVYQQAIAKGADTVVGPLDKNALQMLVAQGKFPVPTIALNYSDNRKLHNLYEFGLSPLDEAAHIAKRAWADGHRRALILAPQNQWGNSVMNAFRDAWQKLGGEVADYSTYRSSQDLDSSVKRLLQAHSSKEKNAAVSRRQDADMIFVVAYASIGRQIIPLLKFYYAQDLPTYALSVIYSGTPSPEIDHDLNGVFFCDMPWIFGEGTQLQSRHNATAPPWPETFNIYARLYALGADAFKLTNELSSLEINSQMSLSGETGVLSLSNQHITRGLSCAQMRDGQPQLIS